ncbi:TonB-dependent siderophore receptor [Methylomonas albis]|uniref:TonB-dependent receptor n=1 Tax=Methylomonas albis TaxID=1854563 RepID=A0ABR9D1R0_9GAMM|nr:TonB-dependent receptor [Methylomonas albis]MBD9357064.1 TonB-dependent receptor [Methylomonas albis]
MSNAKHCNPSAGKGRRHAAKAALLAALISQTAHGDAAGKHHFDIPAQSLNQALLMFGRQSQQQLMYGTDIADNLRSRALQGDYTADEAIRILLGDAPLQAVTTGEGNITLQPKAREMHNKASPDTMAPVLVTGKAVYDITDPTNPSYSQSTASTTKTDTPIMESPFSAKVITKQILKDQQVVRLDKALENISGVLTSQSAAGIGGGQSSIFIRGFQTYEYYRDGARINNGFLVNGPRETANVERVEVLKGPASILYGRMEPGGMVNIVTKKPLATPYYSLQQQFGSFDFYRTTVDATGPVNKDRDLLYRVNLAYENGGSWREFLNNERVFFAPNFQWDISDRTKLNFHLEYQHSNDPFDNGLFVMPGSNRPINLPRERNLAEPGPGTESETIATGYDLTHAFNDNWSIHHRFDAFLLPSADNPPQVKFAGPIACDTVSCMTGQQTYEARRTQESYYSTLDLTGKFDTWGLHHTVLIGGDYQRVQDDTEYFGFNSSDTLPLNAYNPVHTGVNAGLYNRPNVWGSAGFVEEWGGFYTQDQIELPRHVHLLAGFRYDTVRKNDWNQIGLNFGTPSYLPYANTVQVEEAVKPRFGLLWQPIPEVSLYGNYVENFGITNGLTTNNSPLPPTSAQQWEAGIKTELFDSRLTATLAWFDITKQNIATPDPNPVLALLGFNKAVGEVRNRGIEFDVSGEVLSGWNIIGSYAYIDSQITKDTALVGNEITNGNQGHRLWNVPRNSASLWNTYDVQSGDLRGLKVGGGMSLRDQREGDNANSFQLPGYALVNLMAAYSWKVGPTKLTTQLNVNNLLDKMYWDSAANNSSNGVMPGAPRSFLGSVRVEF